VRVRVVRVRVHVCLCAYLSYIGFIGVYGHGRASEQPQTRRRCCTSVCVCVRACACSSVILGV
jgi:hypothetical protein